MLVTCYVSSPPPNPNTCHTTPPPPSAPYHHHLSYPPHTTTTLHTPHPSLWYHHHPSYPPCPPPPAIPLPPLIPSPQPPSTCHPPPPPPPSSWVTPPTPCREIKITKKKKKKVECCHESVTGCIQGIAWIDGAENTKLNKKHFSINDMMSKCFVICYDAHLPLLKACVCPTPDQERPACTCNLKGTQTCLPVWLGSFLYA